MTLAASKFTASFLCFRLEAEPGVCPEPGAEGFWRDAWGVEGDLDADMAMSGGVWLDGGGVLEGVVAGEGGCGWAGFWFLATVWAAL